MTICCKYMLFNDYIWMMPASHYWKGAYVVTHSYVYLVLVNPYIQTPCYCRKFNKLFTLSYIQACVYLPYCQLSSMFSIDIFDANILFNSWMWPFPYYHQHLSFYHNTFDKQHKLKLSLILWFRYENGGRYHKNI